MPVFVLEKIPWPSLHTYTALSAALLAGTVLTVWSSGPPISQSSPDPGSAEETHGSRISQYIRYLSPDYGDTAADVLLYLLTDSVFVWVSKLDSHEHSIKTETEIYQNYAGLGHCWGQKDRVRE